LFSVNDTLGQEIQNALNGFGGNGCDLITGEAGVGACEYYNPFSTSLTTSPNSQNVIDAFTAREVIDSVSNLEVAEAFYSTNLFEMDGGAVGLAVGAQYRYQDLSQDYDSLANQDKFTFVIGNPDIEGEQDVVAVFAEIALPITDTFDAQVALRYEDYGGTTGDTLDYKLAASWRATEDFSLRASASSSFRAPSIFQRDGGATALNQVRDPLTGSTSFAATRASGNPELVPEESTAFNMGLSFEPVDDLSIEMDYWSFDFTDLIIQENFQAILTAEPQNTDRIVRAGDPLNGPVTQVNTTYINASSLETSGLDIVLGYKIDTDMGSFSPSLSATYILAYDLVDPQAGPIDGVGSRNYNNVGTSSPELRANLGLNWKHENYSANVFARYTDSYTDDQNNLKEIDSHLTWDAQLNIDLGGLFETEGAYVLTFGGVNLTDEDPPQVFTNGGFDSKVHDPRGRQVYARLAIEF
jgi:outer membrane receptor protein involved in Fe transport